MYVPRSLIANFPTLGDREARVSPLKGEVSHTKDPELMAPDWQ